MSVGNVGDSQPVQRTRAAEPEAAAPAADKKTASLEPAAEKGNVADSVVQGARSLFQGAEGAIKKAIGGSEPNEELAGKIRICGGGGKCQAQLPTRGLGNLA